MTQVQLVIIAFFIGLVIGYVWGHRQGESVGQEVGLRYGPLEVRRQSLLFGQCQICGCQLPDALTPEKIDSLTLGGNTAERSS